jgi:hypothetical protein
MNTTGSAPSRALFEAADELVRAAAEATGGAPNEAALRHSLERELDQCCSRLGRPLDPFRLEFFVRAGTRRRFIDVAHGAVLIEYEAPRSFSGREGSKLSHARAQLEEYAILLQREEGRPLDEYTMVAWDGAHLSFGRYHDGRPAWEPLASFGREGAVRLLQALVNNGLPLVSPRVLTELVGPDSDLGSDLIPALFRAVRQAAEAAPRRTSNTYLLFTEWRRLFGQVVGTQADDLRKMLHAQSVAHGQPYAEYVPEYLFALNTYIALVAKLVAARSLPRPDQEITDERVSIQQRIRALESGQMFANAGVLNLLLGDFFSWYAYDASWTELAAKIGPVLLRLNAISFDVTRKTADSTRDLFKGLYQSFVPRALRHALGEYYTPDWLAAYTLDQLGWSPDEALLDPTCGSGTFILEALRRRLCLPDEGGERTASRLLHGLYGMDLNPLAVLTARASLVVYLSPYLDPSAPVRLPIFLADALNPTLRDGDLYTHRLQTELGIVEFAIPCRLVEKYHTYYDFFGRLRELIGADLEPAAVMEAVLREFDFGLLTDAESTALQHTVNQLVSMHRRGWDGIWCAVLADRFATGQIPAVEKICGNPPWVKWSHLPPEYASFIKDRCIHLGVFSDDRWVGGIESDISTVVTYEAVARWLAPQGKLAFLITGTVFFNESSQGFRRFELRHEQVRFGPTQVEDFSRLNPFEGVSNYATLMLLERDRDPTYPVPYREWSAGTGEKRKVMTFTSADEFRGTATSPDFFASPVPGTDAGPWMIGTAADHEVWQKLFTARAPAYVARKGVTTDRNGIFFVRVTGAPRGRLCSIENDPAVGRKTGIHQVRASVECEHLYPLLRGRGVSAFLAAPDPELRILLPQRGMHGDPELPRSARWTYAFLARFREELEGRSSYRRFQKGRPFWSVWSTGAYTFSPYKVLWREMGGGKFAAAYVGEYSDPLLGDKLVIPDHKLYFVPVETREEAGFLTGILNAPVVAHAVSSYAAQLSLGASVVEYLDVPRFDPADEAHMRISNMAVEITSRRTPPTPGELQELNRLAYSLFSLA